MTDLIGIPYKDHGRDERGLDCFGLILLIQKRIGKPINDVWYKGFDSSLLSLAEQMNVKKCELEKGCIITLEKNGHLHLGYALDNERMIHCVIGDGVVVEPIPKKIKGCYKWV